MRFLWADLKRGFTEPRFFLALALGCCCALLSLALCWQGVEDGYSLFIQSHSLILPFCAPLLCALPYSNMHMQEEVTGFHQLMAVAYGGRCWVYQRLISNAVVSGITTLTPGVLLLALTLLRDTQALTPEIYGVLGMNFAFGAVFGCLSYGLCFVNAQSYIPLVAPQVLYLFALYACPILGLTQYLPALAFAPWILPSAFQAEHMAHLLVALGLVAVALTSVGRVKKAVAP